MVQCCFRSTETIRLIWTGSPGAVHIILFLSQPGNTHVQNRAEGFAYTVSLSQPGGHRIVSPWWRLTFLTQMNEVNFKSNVKNKQSSEIKQRSTKLHDYYTPNTIFCRSFKSIILLELTCAEGRSFQVRAHRRWCWLKGRCERR